MFILWERLLREMLCINCNKECSATTLESNAEIDPTHFDLFAIIRDNFWPSPWHDVTQFVAKKKKWSNFIPKVCYSRKIAKGLSLGYQKLVPFPCYVLSEQETDDFRLSTYCYTKIPIQTPSAITHRNRYEFIPGRKCLAQKGTNEKGSICKKPLLSRWIRSCFTISNSSNSIPIPPVLFHSTIHSSHCKNEGIAVF